MLDPMTVSNLDSLYKRYLIYVREEAIKNAKVMFGDLIIAKPKPKIVKSFRTYLKDKGVLHAR